MQLTESDFFQFARRYFVKNAFDGVLTILGIVMGSFLSKIQEPSTILFVGISACIGMGVSGMWGTFFTESAERKRKLKTMEDALLTRLDGTRIQRESRTKAFMLGCVDGFSPFLMAFLVMTPFIAALSGFITMEIAYYYSFAFIGIALLLLGAMLGKISQESMVKYALMIFSAGIVAGAINLALTLLQ